MIIFDHYLFLTIIFNHCLTIVIFDHDLFLTIVNF